MQLCSFKWKIIQNTYPKREPASAYSDINMVNFKKIGTGKVR